MVMGQTGPISSRTKLKDEGGTQSSRRSTKEAGAVGAGDHPKLKPSIVFTGTAKECKSGTVIGLIDIGVSQSAFLFLVALPGIRNDLKSTSSTAMV
ncbi:hypothetical protein REPUB_Repub12eG0085600 [Reevesia pubescens]